MQGFEQFPSLNILTMSNFKVGLLGLFLRIPCICFWRMDAGSQKSVKEKNMFIIYDCNEGRGIEKEIIKMYNAGKAKIRTG
jgi:hypothetical protein